MFTILLLISILQTSIQSDEVSISGIEIWFWVGVALFFLIIILIIKHILLTGRIAQGKKV